MSSTGQHTDVIFVVEGTALCGAYLHELRSQYIIPTLEYFSGPIDEKDCGSDSNYCLYGLVVFHAADVLPDFLVNTVGPLNTSYKLLNQIDRIRFTGGHGEAMSNVGEGLATALECLEDLVEFRSTLTDVIAKKHVILICNCKPYGVPVSESEGTSEEFVGKTVEQLAVYMVEKDIHLSIMSPRKIPGLIQLFDHAGGDITNQKGYARDTRHLILLNGYSLKVNEDRPQSPVRISQETFPLATTASQGQTTTSQQLITSSASGAAMSLPITVQQLPSAMSNPQNLQPIVSQPSPMMQLPRSPASSIANSTTTMAQGIQQQSAIGSGMQVQVSPSLQQNMTQLSQQQVMQLQQQQMFQQQQQQFRNPRPMTTQVGGNQMGTMRGPMLNSQQQMNSHLLNQQQGNQVPIGPQQQQHIKLQQQQAFQQQQQQQQQQAQMQNMSMNLQQQNALQQQQNALQQNLMQAQQNPSQQNTLQQIQMQQQQQNPMLQQQQQNTMLQQQQSQLQQNLLQQQNVLQQAQMQQGQNQMQQQNQISMLQSQNPMTQAQNQMQPGQNSMQQGPNSMQPGQNTMQQGQNPMQQGQNTMQQGQNTMQQGQNTMQQGQNSMQQGQNSMQQGQNPMQQGQNAMQQQGQNPMQHQGQSQMQQGQNSMQQGQPTMQQQQSAMVAGQQIGQGMMQQRWPNQMGQQQQQTRIQMGNQIPPHPQPTSSPSLQRPPQEILARLNQPPMASSPGTTNTNPTPLPQLAMGGPQLQRERRVIWNGYLEWHEKQKGTPEGLKIPRQVPCHVSATVMNNEPEVKGDGWPSKLIMQLIPKQIVGNLGGTYFLDVKTVLFILQNCDALVSLTKVMDSGFAGCVHFTGSGVAANTCTIKVLILLYSKERHAYLGFIPNDQAGFVDRIRKVIQQQKTQQAAIRQGGTGIPQSIPQTFGVPPVPGGTAMQGGMVIQGQGVQQSQPPQGGLPVSVQQMSSQPQMMPHQPTASQLQQQLAATPQIPPSAPDSIELERQQNVLKIQQLQQALEQAQQRELIYTQQLQSQGPSGQAPGPGQIMNQGQMLPGQMSGQGQMTQGQMPAQGQMPQSQIPGQGQMSSQGQMTQSQMPGQGQMTMQQGQMLQGQQGMRQGMPPQRMQRASGQLNPGLKHLLQQPGANVGPPGGFRMRMSNQGQQNQMPQQQQQGTAGPYNEDLGILDLLK